MFKILLEVCCLLLQILYEIGASFVRNFIPENLSSVQGEIVLITGGGHGIGQKLAHLYGSQGATVIVWDINKEDALKTVQEVIHFGYPKAHAYICDVSNREQVFETAKKVQKDVGDVTILINNAGIVTTKPIWDYTKDEVERTFKVNLLAHFWTIQAFLPAMKRKNCGHIVAIASMAGHFASRYASTYVASKFGVCGLMETLSEELRFEPNCNVKTTTVCPFFVDTGFCKKPMVRFKNLTPILDTEYVAKAIIKAQRRKDIELFIPSYLIYHKLLRFVPRKVKYLVEDFFAVTIDVIE